MKKIILFMLLLFSIHIVLSYVDWGNGTCTCSDCTDCNNAAGDYNCQIVKLDQSISSDGTCLSIITSPTIDCDYHTISGSTAISLRQSSLILKNCILVGSTGISSDTADIIVYNTTIKASNYGIYIWGSLPGSTITLYNVSILGNPICGTALNLIDIDVDKINITNVYINSSDRVLFLNFSEYPIQDNSPLIIENLTAENIYNGGGLYIEPYYGSIILEGLNLLGIGGESPYAIKLEYSWRYTSLSHLNISKSILKNWNYGLYISLDESCLEISIENLTTENVNTNFINFGGQYTSLNLNLSNSSIETNGFGLTIHPGIDSDNFGEIVIKDTNITGSGGINITTLGSHIIKVNVSESSIKSLSEAPCIYVKGTFFSDFNDYLLGYMYNDIFNCTNPVDTSQTNVTIYWNISKTPGTNIVGGSYIGGNFWATPAGDGFSQTCTDNDNDGICDNPYVIDENNVDYLPLASFQESPSPPTPQSEEYINVSQLARIRSKKQYRDLGIITRIVSLQNTFAIKYNDYIFGIFGGKLAWGNCVGDICYLNYTKEISKISGIFTYSCNRSFGIDGETMSINNPCGQDYFEIVCDNCKVGMIGVIYSE